MINKIKRHIRSGTLNKAFMRKVEEIFLNRDVPIGDEYYGEKAENYLNHRGQEEFWAREEEALARTLGQISDIETVLDVPFGTGRFLELYHGKGLSIFGLDSSKDMVGIAEEHYGDILCKSDVRIGLSTELPFEEEMFDLVVSFRFFPWVISFGDVKKTLTEFHRVLKSEKYAIFEFSVSGKSDEILEVADRHILWDKFNERQIKVLLRDHGFHATKIEHIYDDEENPNVTMFVCRKVDR